MERVKVSFFDVLFNEDELKCFADTVYETAIQTTHFGTPETQYFCINPLLASRRDSNVAVHRNILLEFDVGSPEEQLNTLKHVPYSTLTWSGGKSHHAIISLETPCADRAEYDALVRRIYEKLPTVDKSGKNPSRLSRTPGAYRDNGTLQAEIEVRNRISTEALDAWLGPAPEKLKTEQPSHRAMLSSWTNAFLMFGSEPGKRNADLFRAACDMLRKGYTEEQVISRAEAVLDLTHREMLNTVRSASVTVRRG